MSTVIAAIALGAPEAALGKRCVQGQESGGVCDRATLCSQ
jgi:hypothetical protein